MTEVMPAATEKKVQLNLQLQASSELKKLMSELVQREQRRGFARHVIYLMLYTNPPVEAPISSNSFDGLDSVVSEEIADYTNNIEDVTSKIHMFNRALHLAPQIGCYEHEDYNHGINLSFKLATSAIAAKYLFAPPFDETDPDSAYVLTHLSRRILDDDKKRPFMLDHMRRKISTVPGVNGAQARAPDLYYVSRPEIKKRIIAPPSE